MNSFHNQTIPENDAAAEMLRDCVRDGRLGAAAILIRALDRTERIDALFNIALVYYMAGDYAKSLEYIDLALAAARKRAPNSAMQPRPANYQKLRGQDAVAPLRPISAEYIAAYPDLARDDIAMAGAKIAHAAGMTAKRDGYLSDLRGPEFENFKNGVKQ